MSDLFSSWSGITAEALAPVNTTLSEVQDRLLKLLSPPSLPTPILLGHSLESDLKALKLCHPCCIDTALVYHHPRGRPLKPGLAWLTKKWCGREIQTRGEGGHDPEEDARACLDLMKKKVENGGYFRLQLFFPWLIGLIQDLALESSGQIMSLSLSVCPGLLEGADLEAYGPLLSTMAIRQ